MKYRSTIPSIVRASLIVTGLCFVFSVPVAHSCPCTEVKIPQAVGNGLTVPAGLAFMKTDEYQKEFAKAISDARITCQKHQGEKNLAIVSDIDETVLDNSEYFKTHKEGGWSEWSSWIAEAKAPVLKPSADFLSWARKNGFAIFFITGRNENERKNTITNLVKAGLSYDGLYMRPDGDNSRAEEMKSKYRQQISDMGYKTIVSIGDQYSDLVGGYAEDCEKLPNKLYFIP